MKMSENVSDSCYFYHENTYLLKAMLCCNLEDDVVTEGNWPLVLSDDRGIN